MNTSLALATSAKITIVNLHFAPNFCSKTWFIFCSLTPLVLGLKWDASTAGTSSYRAGPIGPTTRHPSGVFFKRKWNRTVFLLGIWIVSLNFVLPFFSYFGCVFLGWKLIIFKTQIFSMSNLLKPKKVQNHWTITVKLRFSEILDYLGGSLWPHFSKVYFGAPQMTNFIILAKLA